MSLAVKPLAKEFGKSTTDITWGITLVLMLRSVGAIAFGIASDRYGRKWPFVVNNILFIVLELVSRSLLLITPLPLCHSFPFPIRTSGIFGGCRRRPGPEVVGTGSQAFFLAFRHGAKTRHPVPLLSRAAQR